MSSDVFEIRWRARAVRQLDAANAWWIEHRPSAPELLRDEVARASILLVAYPELGVTTARAHVRRLLLRDTSYFVYYRVRPRVRRIEVLAVWSAMRGSGPPLPR